MKGHREEGEEKQGGEGGGGGMISIKFLFFYRHSWKIV